MRKIVPFLILLCLFNSCRKKPLLPESRITPRDFLSAKKYEKLVVEVVHEQGYTLDQATISHLRNFLSARLNKPKGISFTDKEIPFQGKEKISIPELQEIEKKHRPSYSARKTLSVFVFVSGSSSSKDEGDSQILGVAYGSTSIAIFGKTIQQHSGGLVQPSRVILESTVVEHEFGHLMGLVDNGTPMKEYHKDGPNGAHCDKKNCLMNHAAETTDITGNLLGGEVPALENYCIRDLQFNGGK